MLQSKNPNLAPRATGRSLLVALLGVAFIALFFLAAILGSAKIDILSLVKQQITKDYAANYKSQSYIFYHVRMPRISLCALTGMSLGISGCIMQTILRNPLASPFTLGVSSGASFGAAVAMILGIKLVNLNFLFQGYSFVAVNAFVFGCLSLVIVMGVSKLCNNSTTVLILTGTAISSLFSAGVSILKYISNAESLKNLEIWLMGGFWGANWNAVLTILPFFVVCIIYVLLCAWDLNSMSAGEDVARTMGVNVLTLKIVSMVLVTLVASVSIAFCGIIGFIGLVAPHISRSIVGVDNRKLIPASAFVGGSVLLVSDTVARTIVSPKEIPVGIITSLIGVPFFIFILTRKKKQLWGA